MLHRVRRSEPVPVDPATPHLPSSPSTFDGVDLAALFARARMPVAIVYQPEHRLEFANDACGRWLADPTVGRRLEESVPGEQGRDLAQLVDESAARSEARVGRSLRMPGEQADRFWDVTCEPLLDPAGPPTRVLIHAVDVTDDRGATHRLHESAEVRQAGLDVLGAGTFRWVIGSGRLTVDPALRELVGFEPGGDDTLDALLARMHPEDRTRLSAACHRCADEGGALREGARVVLTDQRVRWLDFRARLRGAPDARDAEVIGACIDVTESCEREQDWADLMAVLTHELRTPLNAIGGYACLMLEGIPVPAAGPQVGYLKGIDRSYRHLMSLVDAVLTRAKARAGKTEYRIEETTIGRILDDMDPLIEPQRREKRLRWDVGACDRSLAVRVDREKVVQILLNLVSNSVKFTPAGGTIRVRTEASPPDLCVLVVEDTGSGMTPEQAGRIFEPFTQFDEQAGLDRRGTGLGMSISREFARGMGGELTVASVVGKGSLFRLRLPSAA